MGIDKVRITARGPICAFLEDVQLCFICLLAVRATLEGDHVPLVCPDCRSETSCQQGTYQ